MLNMKYSELCVAALKVPPESAHETIRFVSQVLMFSSKGTLLTLKKARQRSGDAWDLPGGGVEVGEDFLKAADRELREELRLIPSGRYYPLAFTFEKNNDRQDYAVMTFVTSIKDELSPMVDGVEHKGFLWQKWGSIMSPRTQRFDRFLHRSEINHLTVQDLSSFVSRRAPLVVASPPETRQPHPFQQPSLEG